MVQRSDWCVIVPLSSAAQAKSRLSSLGPWREPMALSLATDVISTLLAARGVSQVLVTSDGSLAVETGAVHVDSGTADLNGSIQAAESRARREGFECIAVVMADLPCVRPEDVEDFLTRARRVPRGFVRDHRGSGTTVLTTTGPGLLPRFGGGSAAGHRAEGAVEFEVSIRMRFDIDDPEDITVALAFGLGPATSATLGQIQGSASVLPSAARH